MDVTPQKNSLRRRFRHWRRRQRNRLLVALGPPLIRLWLGTVKTRWIFPGFEDHEKAELTDRIYCAWHQHYLLFVKTHRNTGIRMLMSDHGDGRMIAGIARRLGFGIVSGSSTRGGTRAVRSLLDAADDGKGFAFTPDGPRGPRHRFRPGAVYFASRSGRPLVALHVQFDRCWQLGTWDGFMIPKLFSRCVVKLHEGFTLPEDIDRAAQQEWCRTMERVHAELSAECRDNFDELFENGLEEHQVVSLWR